MATALHNKGWLKKVIEKVHCQEGSLILPKELINANHSVGFETIKFSMLIPKVYNLDSPLSLVPESIMSDAINYFQDWLFFPHKLICYGFKNAPLFVEGNNVSSLICENS